MVAEAAGLGVVCPPRVSVTKHRDMADDEMEGAPTAPFGSFDTFLRRAAHVSVNVARERVLPAGATLAEGRLSIARKLGEGGMGVVYKALDTQRRRWVALKTMSRAGPAEVYRLKSEFRALADVKHDNLVTLHELFSEGELWFFTMDLIEGVPFDAWVRPDSALDETRLRAAIPQLLAAVSALHGAGKLHRDLKPSNVLVGADGRVVVLDFGLAVDPELGGVGQTLGDESVSGTPAYMSPEQAAGKAATQASDLYAIGAMLFEALTGRLPFEGSVPEMLVDKQRSEAPRASAFGADVPGDLDALCAGLLACDPSVRPRAAELSARFGPAGTQLAPQLAQRALPELLGRSAELEALRGAFAASCAGHKPVIVLLAGESGIGKSALCEIFLAELRAEGRALVLSGRCFERESVPFKAFDLAIDQLSRQLRKLGDAARDLMPREAYALRRLFPVLGRVPAIADAPERQISDPQELRERAFRALGELLGRIRDRQPLVLQLDDLQWSDADSTVLLLHLLRQVDAPKLLLIVSHRSEHVLGHAYLQPLYDVFPIDVRLDTRKLALGPLPAAAALELLNSQAQNAPDWLRELGGNPLLISELARHAATHADALGAQLTLQDVIAFRVAALAHAERRVLQLLAVASRPVSLELALRAAAVEVGPRPLLEALSAAHLARATGDRGEVECFHDKVRETLLGALDAAALRELHRALADALAALPAADAEQLAAHLLGAGDEASAAVQLARAADQAFSELSFDRAARLYAEALAGGRFLAEEAQRLRVARAGALAHAGRGALAAEAYLEASRHTSADAAHALEHEAALQYLYSGRREQGRPLLARSLERHGILLPHGTRSTIAALVYERIRLKLHGLEFRERAPDPVKRAHLDVLADGARALVSVDFVGGALLSGRALRLALAAGDAEGVAIGLIAEIWNRTLGIGKSDTVPELLLRVEAMFARSDGWRDPHGVRRLFHIVRGFYNVNRPDARSFEVVGELALADYDDVLRSSREHPSPNAAYERGLAQLHRAILLIGLCRFAELARELPALCDSAWERGDAATPPMFCQTATVALIAVAAREEAQFHVERAGRAWAACRNAYSFQDVGLLLSEITLALDAGDARGAHERVQADVARFEGSPLRSSAFYADMVTWCAMLSAAGYSASLRGRERAEVVHLVRRMRMRTDAADPPMMGSRPLHRAVIALMEGRQEIAVEALRQALKNFWAPWFVLPIHRAIGRLLGGDEGRAIIADADAALRAGGAVDPKRIASALLPGIDLLLPRE